MAVETNIILKLKPKTNFESHPDFNELDLPLLNGLFRRPVTVTKVNPKSKVCYIAEYKEFRFYPDDFMV